MLLRSDGGNAVARLRLYDLDSALVKTLSAIDRINQYLLSTSCV